MAAPIIRPKRHLGQRQSECYRQNNAIKDWWSIKKIQSTEQPKESCFVESKIL